MVDERCSSETWVLAGEPSGEVLGAAGTVEEGCPGTAGERYLGAAVGFHHWESTAAVGVGTHSHHRPEVGSRGADCRHPFGRHIGHPPREQPKRIAAVEG